MSNIDIIRAWKDEEYRNSLTDEQRSQLPENPAGMVEMSDEEMENVGGALGRSSCQICPTPPIILSKQVVCNSAVDACPTRLCVITKSNNAALHLFCSPKAELLVSSAIFTSNFPELN